MKLYEFTMAPNPRRVRVFLAEKGIQVPLEQVDIGKSENRTPEFLARNPLGRVPVLELDDGTHIAETVAICRYFEELQPEPPPHDGENLERIFTLQDERKLSKNLILHYKRVTYLVETSPETFRLAGQRCRVHEYEDGRIGP